MNQQAKDIIKILNSSGYKDSELTANLLSVVDKEAAKEYLQNIENLCNCKIPLIRDDDREYCGICGKNFSWH